MKSVYKYLLFSLVFALFLSCSDDNKELVDEDYWNRFRTTDIVVYSHLSDMNLFATADIKEVTNSIRNTSHSVAILDRSNALYGSTSLVNTGVEVASGAQKVPVFVPGAYHMAEKKIIGNTVLLPTTISSLVQHSVKDYCKYLEIDVNAYKQEKMKFSTVTLVSEDLIAPMLQVFKDNVQKESVVVGTIKRSLMSSFESTAKTILASTPYSLTEIKNKDNATDYCIFLLSSDKWKLREMNEKHIAGNINSYQLQVEFLK